MPAKEFICILLTVFTSAAFAQSRLYITNISVLDVTAQKVRPAQTVEITGEMITAIGASGKIKIPDNSKVIDGTGKFLMPGMCDAHVHFFQSGGLYARPDAIKLSDSKPYANEIEWVHRNMDDALRRYLRCGITSVVDVGATFSFLEQRDSFKNRATVPEIFMTGPLLTTWEPPAYEHLGNDEPFTRFTSAEDARKKVREQLQYKPDFIKIWYITRTDSGGIEASARKYQPMVKAAIEEAHLHNLKVAVHATERITAQLAVESGCDFLVHSVDDEVINESFIHLLKSHNTVLCPTLIVHNGYLKTFAQQHQFSEYELRHANPWQLGSLYDLRHSKDTGTANMYLKRYSSAAAQLRLRRSDSVSMVNLKKLADAGVVIAAGTDAGNIGTLHASSYLSELAAMQQCGLSNWQILQAATINTAFIVGQDRQRGSITVGKQASLLILDGNPAEDIKQLQHIRYVIHRGVVTDPATLIENTPEALAQQQLNGYNTRNIEAFLEPYAEDIEIYQYPDSLLWKGKTEMRTLYSRLFELSPDLHCEVRSRIVQGNVVIDQERVLGLRKNKVVEATAIYHIKDGKIVRVYFIR